MAHANYALDSRHLSLPPPSLLLSLHLPPPVSLPLHPPPPRPISIAHSASFHYLIHVFAHPNDASNHGKRGREGEREGGREGGRERERERQQNTTPAATFSTWHHHHHHHHHHYTSYPLSLPSLHAMRHWVLNLKPIFLPTSQPRVSRHRARHGSHNVRNRVPGTSLEFHAQNLPVHSQISLDSCPSIHPSIHPPISLSTILSESGTSCIFDFGFPGVLLHHRGTRHAMDRQARGLQRWAGRDNLYALP